jgi:ribosomal protein S12
VKCKLDAETEKEEKPVKTNQGWEPIHQKYKANENTSIHNSKNKKKANNQPKSSQHPMQRGFMTNKSTMTKKTTNQMVMEVH